MDDPFSDAPAPGQPGWREWKPTDPTRFNAVMGPVVYRAEGAIVRVRMTPGREHSNVRDAVHGGVTLAFIDIALFAAARASGTITTGTGVTLGLETQFIGEGAIGEPIEAQVELLRETGRLLFLRGLVVQGDGDRRIAAFSAMIRKPPSARKDP
ncbi:PaaI family thioesterase [Sphingomonas sp. CFBP 8760]|uniref:PaaI family thioesterase n=1 Tax=Sphingomonas sp. CFBP 8760 TaxID=2775282 RepID=UPI001FCE6168|nr:PaaI family thioesterase [Sphingomonas sp. CFBP 8760]